MIEFNSSPDSTIGVEIELQFIDVNTLDLKNIASGVLVDIDKKFSNRIKHELFEKNNFTISLTSNHIYFLKYSVY